MGNNIVVYAGSGLAGNIREKAIRKEARKRHVPIYKLIMESLKKQGSKDLRDEFAQADLLER